MTAVPVPPATTSASKDSSTRRRDGFALTGPSVPLDPRVHAVRPDLADVRLAGKVFAPHFAASIPGRVVHPVALTRTRQSGDVLAPLAIGERFDVLEVAGASAWGIATGPGLVGYVDYDALEMDA